MGSCFGKEERPPESTNPLVVGCQYPENFISLFAHATMCRVCRICSEKRNLHIDPVVNLGCKCLGKNGTAHESCIRKWFPRVFIATKTMACEICKARLGAYARTIVKNEIRSKVYQYLFRERILKDLATEHAIITMPVIKEVMRTAKVNEILRPDLGFPPDFDVIIVMDRGLKLLQSF